MDFPDDLLKLQAAFFELDQCCAELAAKIPSGPELNRKQAELPADEFARLAQECKGLEAELERARAVRLEKVLDKARHEWWGSAPNRFEADKALRLKVKDDQALRAAVRKELGLA